MTSSDRLFCGWYDKSNRSLIAALRKLTGGRFRPGAIARMLAIEFWTRGEAPTLSTFASAWLAATARHPRPNPEWAFLSDRSAKGAVPEWKALRRRKASSVLTTLDRICAAALPL
jgi:hypothetical protein